MKLYYNKKSKDPTYYAQVGIRNGKKTTTKNVKNFGKHSELLKITDDPEAYVREEIRKMNDEYRVGKVSFELTADFNVRVKDSGDDASSSTALNIGYFFLQDVMKGLNLRKFFQQAAAESKITFDSFTIARFLIYARILHPGSKLSAWESLSAYYEQPKFDYQHILRFMDLLADNYDGYLTWLYKNSCSIVDRDTSVLYYDCTNFYFECEQQDEDFVDKVTGEIIPGIRKYGISKEHRPNPIVEMGLFMDSRGIPITMCLHPGNTNEGTTVIPLEKEVQKMLGTSRFIYCADAGLGSFNIRQFNSMGGKAFVVTQSIKKLGSQLQEAVFNDYDYRLLSSDSPVHLSDMKTFDLEDKKNLDLYNDYVYKVIDADHAVDLGLFEDKVCSDGRVRRVKATGQMKQRVIITFSRKTMEYQRAVRNRQIERARQMLKNCNPDEIKKTQNDARRFLKRVSQDKSGKEVKTCYELDQDRIDEEEKYDGFYAVATNLDDPVKDILAISHGRHRIEECFRVMKTDLSGRPVNHRLPQRIAAHFLLCYTALLVSRLLEVQLDDKGTHVTTENLFKTLRNMNVVNVHDVEYMALYTGSNALNALTELTSLQLDRLHYTPKELNKMIRKFLK